MLPHYGVLSGTLVTRLPHDLQHTPSSGAWDYIRSALFRVRLGCLFVMMPDAVTRVLMQIFEALLNVWQRGGSVFRAGVARV